MESETKVAAFIRLKMKELNLSAYDVARRAGNKISPTTITKILSGEVNRSGAKTLALIAKGLGVTEIEMFRVANGEDISRPLHYQIYAERFNAEGLSDSEWQMLEIYFKDYVKRWQQFQADREAGKFVELIEEEKSK